MHEFESIDRWAAQEGEEEKFRKCIKGQSVGARKADGRILPEQGAGAPAQASLTGNVFSPRKSLTGLRAQEQAKHIATLIESLERRKQIEKEMLAIVEEARERAEELEAMMDKGYEGRLEAMKKTVEKMKA